MPVFYRRALFRPFRYTDKKTLRLRTVVMPLHTLPPHFGVSAAAAHIVALGRHVDLLYIRQVLVPIQRSSAPIKFKITLIVACTSDV